MIYDVNNRFFEGDLVSFCKKYKTIYLYGAGSYGKSYFLFLKDMGIQVRAFIVTQKENIKIFGIPVLELVDIDDKACGIVFSLKEQFHYDIESNLRKHGFKNILKYSDDFSRSLYNKNFFQLSNHQLVYLKKYLSDKIENTNVRKSWESILIIRLDAIGDFVLTTPFLRELKRIYPQSKITMLVRPILYDLLEYCPYVDHILTYDVEHELKNFTVDEKINKWKSYWDENKNAYDAAFFPRLDGEPWGEIISGFLSGAAYRIGHSESCINRSVLNKNTDQLLSLAVKTVEIEHTVLANLNLLKALGVDIINDQLELWLDADDEYFADRLFLEWKVSSNTKVIVVALSASIPKKIWDYKKYLAVTEKIIKKYKNVKILLLGGIDAIEIAREFENRISFSSEFILNMVNRTSLRQTAALVKRCSLYLGNDTGLMHIAAVYKLKIIEISYYPKNAPLSGISIERFGPWKTKSISLQPERGLDGCINDCCKNYAHCINQVSIDEVWCAIEKILEN